MIKLKLEILLVIILFIVISFMLVDLWQKFCKKNKIIIKKEFKKDISSFELDSKE